MTAVVAGSGGRGEGNVEPDRTGDRHRLNSRFAYLNRELSGRSFLMGDSFTVADAYLFTVLNWARMLKMDMAAYPSLNAFVARVEARPAVQSAMRAEGLLK